MDEKLKPCPFCGVNGLPHPLDHKEGCYLRYFYEILAERASTGGDVMREAWNTRAERTCRIEGTYSDEYAVYDHLTCGHVNLRHWPEPTSYCSTCGAKVVE